MSGESEPRTLVIVNPASAGGRTSRRWPALHAALLAAGVAHDVHHTTAPDDATTATRAALASGYTRVAAVGGDGTLNEVVNGFFSPDGVPLAPDAALAMLPSGTGGDFRRTAGLPTDPGKLASILRDNHTRRIDAGRIVYDDPATAPRQFINIADCGVGGEVVARVNRSRNKSGGLRGTAVFMGIALKALMTFGGRPVRVRLGSESLVANVQNVIIANGRFFGGGMHIAPGADLADGVFDVVMWPAMSRRQVIAVTPAVYRGRHLGRPGVIVRRASEVRVEPLDERPLLFDIEGEQIGRAPATLTCVPAAINLCVGVGPTDAPALL